MVFFLDDGHFFHLELGVRYGTSTQAKLLDLWELLSYAKLQGLNSVKITSDSRVVVNWF
jgi:ribonuclease HI